MAGGRKRVVVNNNKKRERVPEKEPVTPVVARGRRAAPELEVPMVPRTPINMNEPTPSVSAPVKKKITFSDQISHQIAAPVQPRMIPAMLDPRERHEDPSMINFDTMKELIEYFCDAGARNGVLFGDSIQMAQDFYLGCLLIGPDGDSDLSFCGHIDRAWHHFLLNTIAYKTFCEKLGFFVHHTTKTDNDPDQAYQARVREMMRRARQTWGNHVFRGVWWPQDQEPRRELVYEEVDTVEPTFTIRINHITGKTYTQVVTKRTTVRELKELLYQAKKANEPAMQRIIFAGHELDDDVTMGTYNIRDQTTLHAVDRLIGC